MKAKKIKIIAAGLAALLVFSLSGCARTASEYEYTFWAMDTVISVSFSLEGGGEAAAGLAERCEALISEIEAQASRTLPDSDISSFNRAEDSAVLGSYTLRAVEAALELYERSGGFYDITVAPLVELWNITAGEPELPLQRDIDAALEHIGGDRLSLSGSTLYKSDPETAIDLGGIAKGMALGEVAELIRESGAERALISFGGNVALVGSKENGEKWKIGVRDPYDPSQTAGFIYTDGGCIAVSGDYERYFELDGVRYHHIMSPETGYPVSNGVHSAAVLSEDAMTGDALSTALFCGGPELADRLYRDGYYKFEALIIYDGGVYMTDGMKTMFEKA